MAKSGSRTCAWSDLPCCSQQRSFCLTNRGREGSTSWLELEQNWFKLRWGGGIGRGVSCVQVFLFGWSIIYRTTSTYSISYGVSFQNVCNVGRKGGLYEWVQEHRDPWKNARHAWVVTCGWGHTSRRHSPSGSLE